MTSSREVGKEIDNMAQETEDHFKEMEKPDMIERDPNNINDHIGVEFEDIIAEPDGAHSQDCVWRNSYKCFNCGKNLCYKILTFICALPLALCWGCSFACISFSHIWQVTPCYKVLDINCGCIRKFWGLCVNCAIGPCCEACSLFFAPFASSGTKVTIQ
ncbi:unnamed protein product [Owenia fusiformis]|uniref:Caveolin n=1 Tax=Owenia fusiformis TaxID=6347 RepID=A0A8J1T7U8_OWEFU|nr:unnamed protein product [Owenia fusiformis]